MQFWCECVDHRLNREEETQFLAQETGQTGQSAVLFPHKSDLKPQNKHVDTYPFDLQNDVAEIHHLIALVSSDT